MHPLPDTPKARIERMSRSRDFEAPILYKWRKFVREFRIVRFVALTVLVLYLFPWLAIGQDKPEKAVKTEPAAKTFRVEREVWTTPFKSQGRTGTCWCFSTTSFLESEAHRLGRGDFELSQMHTVYYAYIEKALRRVRSHGTNPFRNGGLAHDVLYVIGKYGAVPRSVYSGLPLDAGMPEQREMDKVLAGMLSSVISAGDEKVPLSGSWTDGRFEAPWFNAFSGILNAYMDRPPATFDYKGNILSPKQFATDVLKLPLDDYVEVTSYSQIPFYATGELLLPDNWLHYDRFYNVPLDDFVRIVDHALGNGFSLVFDLHMTEEEFKSTKDYALGHDEAAGIAITQNRRDNLLESWRTEDVHLEHAIGIARDEAGRKFYKAKDSVGAVGDTEWPVHNIEYLSEAFLRSRVLFVLVHKDGLPGDVRARLRLQ